MRTGDELPALERTITQTDMVAYAGATWDWHRLHYDQAYAEERGLPKPVVDGQMLGALMAKQLVDGLGPSAFITKLGFRFKAMVFAGDTVRIEATITDVSTTAVEVVQRVRSGEALAAEGTATVRL